MKSARLLYDYLDFFLSIQTTVIVMSAIVAPIWHLLWIGNLYDFNLDSE